jgi:N6-adenosine-specific RNA methylase IME4
MAGAEPSSSILWQNGDKTITLIDIPTTIRLAQSFEINSRKGRLLSCEPLQKPFPSTEPKSAKAVANLRQRSKLPEQLSSLYTSIVDAALAEINSKQDSPWCLPRAVSSTPADPLQAPHTHLSRVLESIVSQTRALNVRVSGGVAISPTSEPKPSQSPEDDEIIEEWDGSYLNKDCVPLRMTILEQLEEPSVNNTSTHTDSLIDERPQQPLGFTIPSESVFLQGDCKNSSYFRRVVRSYAQDYGLAKHFDLILLDPPWTNKSATRKGAYNVGDKHVETRKLLLNMDLDQYIAPNGLVGVWVTNNATVRNIVIGPGGLFEQMNVTLVEEWIWVKTTASGEPVTELDGLWRKPYEVLLLGQAPDSRLTLAHTATEIKRRVVVGVPDLHSRKPCLKELFEEFLPDRYQALEIFARYLVAGWFSWGNEVLKYNWDGYWSEFDEEVGGVIKMAEEEKT